MLQEQDAKMYPLSAFAPASCCVTWFWFVKAKAQEEPIAVGRYGGNMGLYICIKVQLQVQMNAILASYLDFGLATSVLKGFVR